MSAGAWIARLVIPIALFGPESVDAGKLIAAPVVLGLHDLAGDIFRAVRGAGNFDLARDRCGQCHLRCKEGL